MNFVSIYWFMFISFTVEKSEEKVPVLNSFSNNRSVTKLLSLSAMEEGREKEALKTKEF